MRKRMWAGVAVAVALVPIVAVSGVTAASQRTLKVKTLTVKPSGKKARFTLTVRGTKVTLSLYVKRKGKYVLLKRRNASRPLLAGSTDIRLTADQAGAAYEKNGGQGLVSWSGPDSSTDADDYAEYYGWNVGRPKLEFFGLSR